MEQWISIKGISKKYQIEEGEVEELVNRKWVTYSEAFHTLLIDEKSFLAYLELHQQLENRKLVIEKLDKLNSQLNTKLRVCEEANATYVITDQLLPLYPFIINVLARFLQQGILRNVFYSLAKGEHLESVAKRYGINIKTTLRIYNYAIKRIKVRAMAYFEETIRHGTCIELLDRHYMKDNIKYKKYARHRRRKIKRSKKSLPNN